MPLLQAHSSADGLKEWIPENYQKVVSTLRKANIIKDYRMGQSVVRSDAFLGEDLVNLIVHETGVKRHEALKLAETIVTQYFRQSAQKSKAAEFDPRRAPRKFYCPFGFYALKEDDALTPLNGTVVPSPSVGNNSVATFNDALQDIGERLFRLAFYYDRLDNTKEFEEYLALIHRAAFLDLEQATPEERLTFFVNVYNLMLLHVAYKYGPPTTVWQRRKHFNCTYYLLGGHLYSLQSIQNGILRGNRTGIGMLWKPFGKEDLRRPYAVKGGESLTHFAINNCTRSSPPLKMYSAETIHEELRASAQNMLCTDEFLRLDAKKRSISVSKIFKIYAEDFGETAEEVIEWIISTLPDGDLKDALKMLYDSEDFSFHFIPLDLRTNMLRDSSH